MQIAKRSALILSIALLAGLLARLADHAVAQTPDMKGSYVLDVQASDDVVKKIDDLVKDMGVLKGRARDEFAATNLPPPPRLAISYTSTEVTITTDADGPIAGAIDGTPSPWKRKDGTKISVSNRWSGGTLQRTLISGKGERVNTYTLGSDGVTLTMSVVVTSNSMFSPGTLRYTLVYRRASS